MPEPGASLLEASASAPTAPCAVSAAPLFLPGHRDKSKIIPQVVVLKEKSCPGKRIITSRYKPGQPGQTSVNDIKKPWNPHECSLFPIYNISTIVKY
jgi:hypothetical protein